MHFIVDTVSEFSYFENLLLGLARTLDKRIGVTETYLKKTQPISYTDISNWEQKYGVLMPEDFRLFYTSGNGYSFEWKYAFDEEEESKNKVIGSIKINELEKVVPIYGYETTTEPGVNLQGERYVIKLSTDSKVFELAIIPDWGHVVLVYLYPKYVPTIWMLTENFSLYFLANDLATYLRMCVVHLGLPNWQIAYVPQGIPQWTENMFRILAPHLLPLNKMLEKVIREKQHRKDQDCLETPINKLDPNIFKFIASTGSPVTINSNMSTQELEIPKQLKKSLTKQSQKTRNLSCHTKKK